MKLLMTMLFVVFAQNAFAHFEIGTYQGKNGSGEACEFTIKEKTYSRGLKHPLEERVVIDIHFSSEERKFKHLPLLDETAGKIRPKKEVLTSIRATETGANAYELYMNHDGPIMMVYMVDNYQDESKSSITTCADLEFQGN